MFKIIIIGGGNTGRNTVKELSEHFNNEVIFIETTEEEKSMLKEQDFYSELNNIINNEDINKYKKKNKRFKNWEKNKKYYQ